MEEKKNLKKKESIFKRAGRSIGNGCKWLYEKRHWIGGIGLGIFAIYAKGLWDGERCEREYRDKDEQDRMNFMKALVGDKTGLTEEQIDQGIGIKNALERMDIDMDKLYEIQEYWSEDDWHDFIEERYGDIQI